MLNLGFKNWILPYVEGTLDPRRRAILEARLKTDPTLAVELENVRRIDGSLRRTALAERPDRATLIDARPSVWPGVHNVIVVRRASSVYVPRFALAGGLAVVAAASIYWIGDAHKSTPPATANVASILPAPVVVPDTPVPNIVAPTRPAMPVPYRPTDRAASRNVVAHADARPTPGPAVDRSAPPLIPVEYATSPRIAGANVTEPPAIIDQTPTVPATTDRPTSSEPMVAKITAARMSTSTSVHFGNLVSEGDAADSLPSTAFDLPSTTFASDGTFAPKAVALSATATGGPRIRVDVTDNADSSLKVLRDNAVAAIKYASKPADLKDAFEAWRDALQVDLNPMVDQNSTTSAQVDATLQMLQDTGHLSDFGDMIKQECATSPNDVAPWRIIAHTYLTEGDRADAVDAWTHVVGLANASAEDWYQLARVQDAGGVTAGAIAAYGKVVDLGEPSRVDDATARIASLSK